MSDCTHNCNTCGGGCHHELPDGEKPRDVLEELKGFMKECENNEDVMAAIEKMAAELDA